MRVHYLALCGTFLACICNIEGTTASNRALSMQRNSTTEEGTNREQVLKSIVRMQKTDFRKHFYQNALDCLFLIDDYLVTNNYVGMSYPKGTRNRIRTMDLYTAVKEAQVLSPKEMKANPKFMNYIWKESENILKADICKDQSTEEEKK